MSRFKKHYFMRARKSGFLFDTDISFMKTFEDRENPINVFEIMTNIAQVKLGTENIEILDFKKIE